MTPDEILRILKLRPLHIGSFTFSLEYRRCGKCSRCADGSRPHGPYLYVRSKSGRRRYIGTPDPATLASIKVAAKAILVDIP